MKIQSLRGFNDVLPAEAALWRRLDDAFRGVAAAYGYRELRLPLMESTELFKRSVGEATDIVEKEMFSFLDREKNSLSLRPEATAGMVRAGIEHGLLHNQQQRLWCAGPMFRHERPQAGRYRQFHQYDVEAFGIAAPEIDVEVIALSARLFRTLELTGLKLELNTLGTPQARAEYRGALLAFLQSHEAALDADSRRRLTTNPLRVLDSKEPATQAILVDAPALPDFLDADSRAHFETVKAGLQELQIVFELNPRLVRGLDYYTRTVFEWTTDRLGAQGTVCAGGRYDGLVAQLGGGDVPAIGFALGVERLALLLQKQQPDLLAAGAPDVYFCWLGDEALRPALRLAESLRDRGVSVVLNGGSAALKAQLRRADGCGARYAAILGGDEAARQVIQVKSLRDSSPQTECAWAELPARMASLLNPA